MDHIDPCSKLIRFVFLWACSKLEVEIIEYMIEKQIFGVWEEKMLVISQNVGTPMKGVNGDTPMHFILRKHCRNQNEYDNQSKLIQILMRYQNPNQKNSQKVAPIHEILQVPSIRVRSSILNRVSNHAVKSTLITTRKWENKRIP